MTQNEKTGLLVVLLALLLFIFLKKKGLSAITTNVSSQLLDPKTGLPIIEGISNGPQAIGPVLLPPGVSNQYNDPAFADAVKNNPLPLCPTGYHAVLDSGNGGAFCVRNSYSPSQTITKFLN